MGASAPLLTGLILAGGAARRLGGEKAGRRVGGTSLLERALDAAGQSCDDLWLLSGARQLAAAGGLPLADPQRVVPSVADDERFAGPLAGLAAGLAVARHDWCLLLACDQPFVRSDVVAELARRVVSTPGLQVLVLEDEHGPQPFCGLYHRSLLADLSAVADDHSLRGLIRAARSATLAVSTPAQRDCLVDVDTPDDLARARALHDGTVAA